jgi:N-acyl homoserine lactone hydrolase
MTVVRTPVHSADISPIRSVAVLSTGSVDIRPRQAFGSRWPLYAWLLASRRWLPPRPINVFVVDHADGLILFDSGEDRAVVTDADYLPPGWMGWLYRRLARFHIGPRETLTAQLEGLGYDPARVQKVVLSHLHQDHIGGIRALRHAEMVVADREWVELTAPRPELRGFMRRHIDLPGVTWRRIGFEPTNDPELAPFEAAHDLLGDGSLVLLPTPGHTPGSLSLLVRRSNVRPLLMVGDLTYGIDLMDEGRIPGIGARRALEASTSRVRRLRARLAGLAVLAAHDPAAAELLRRANA